MSEVITKAAKVQKFVMTEPDLELINKHAIEPLTSEEIFSFKVAVCDNEVDRDFEVFPRASLEKMAVLFVGKTIMKDHQNQTDNQVARIFKTEVEEIGGSTKNGEAYARLVAYCYMVKTDSNKDLITEINAGIKKEVSVGLRTKKAICSICGTDNREGYCKHWNGREYDGKQCYFKLEEPTEAYEVSFVAVPAQPKAGVVKTYAGEPAEEDLKNQNSNAETEAEIDTDIGIIKAFIFAEKNGGNYE